MHEDGARTYPIVRPTDLEWSFPEGSPQLVVHVPDQWGEYSIARLDAREPFPDLTPHGREFARTLLKLALANLDATEPTNPNGVAS